MNAQSCFISLSEVTDFRYKGETKILFKKMKWKKWVLWLIAGEIPGQAMYLFIFLITL